MANTVVSYPIPLFANVPINAQYYQPSRFVISGVTLGTTTTITTSIAHNYVIGQTVRLLIPSTYGCRQLNRRTGNVITVPSPTSVTLDIFSVGGNAFAAGSGTTPPQILAIGDINNGIISSTSGINTTTNIPGSFINISPL